MKKVLIGSSNQAKIDTYKKLLAQFNLDVVSAQDLKIPPAEENAETFEQEAVNKAKYYFEKSGIPALVDDGGMQIDALNGEPGIKSRRWIGREMTDEEIVAEVMKRMKGVPPDKRGCKFTVVLGLATPYGIFTAHGDICGIVPDKPSSKMVKGYPYDSVIFLPNYGKYISELPEQESEIVNQRASALEKLKDILKELSK